MKILFFGDIVGRPGRDFLKKHIADLKQEHAPDVVIANGENASGGFGIEAKQADEIFGCGVQVITTGNHIWNRPSLNQYLKEDNSPVVRPDNYPKDLPGRGYHIHEFSDGKRLAVVNLMGRVFMEDTLECPFQSFDMLIENELKEEKCIFVDFHAETTSEKIAFGYHCEGRASVVVGTHTHVQTADHRVLKDQTAYISDVGMCGPIDGVIGMDRERVLQRFKGGARKSLFISKGKSQLNAVIVEIDSSSGRALSIEPIRLVE